MVQGHKRPNEVKIMLQTDQTAPYSFREELFNSVTPCVMKTALNYHFLNARNCYLSAMTS